MATSADNLNEHLVPKESQNMRKTGKINKFKM